MKISNKKILVTGGAGFIGSNLVDELITDNQVTVVDDFSSGKRENLSHLKNNPDFTLIEGDIRDRDHMFELVKGKDVVFHLAIRCLRVSISDPEVNHQVNATGTFNLLMAAREYNVKRFIYISTSEIYGTAITVPMNENHPMVPTTVYGASKLAGELYARTFHNVYGLPTIAIRPFNTYGPREHYEGLYGEVIPKFFIRLLNDLPPVIFGSGEQTRDFTYVKDTVKGMKLAAECDDLIGEVVNVARGQEVSIKRIAEIVIDTVGKKDIEPLLERERPADVMRHFADISKAKKMFGYEPAVSIEEGISKYYTWLLEQKLDFKECLKKDQMFNW